MSTNVCPGDILRTSEPFVTKPGTAIHHHKLLCDVKILVYYFQSQRQSEGSCKQHMNVSTVFSYLKSFCNKTYFDDIFHKPKRLVKRLHGCVQDQSQSKVQMFSEYFSGRYFLNC